MTQLSTDTLAYTQIISKVQDFVLKYYTNENNEPIDFDKEYKALLLEIEKSIGGPLSKPDFFHKGEIPSSSKFNNISQQMSRDINMLINQLDGLVANYVNSFNQITNYIEEEKNFVSRIKSKINVLELYSNSSSNNITYLSDFFDNLDNVDISKIKTGYIPEISEGFASLPKKNVKKAHRSIAIINQNYNGQENRSVTFSDISNGMKGNYHLFYDDNDPTTPDPFLYERDAAFLKSNVLAMIDESPATYFEYEGIKVTSIDSVVRPDYEFKFSLDNQRSNLVDWSNFDTQKPLKLSLEITLQNPKGSDINHISIVPFFGYDGIDLTKNIKVTSLKIYDDSTEQPKIYTLIGENSGNEAYIGSDVVASSLSIRKRYYYKKGVFRFGKVKATKVYMTLEQSQFNDVKIKHAYWTPYETQALDSSDNTVLPWNGQERFNPLNVVVDGNAAQNVSWNKSSIIPHIEKPEEKKTITRVIPRVDITYKNVGLSTVKRIKYQYNNTTDLYYYGQRTIDGNIYKIFTPKESSLAYNSSTSDTDLQQIIDDVSRYDNSDNESDNRFCVIFITEENTDINTYIDSLKKPLLSMSATDTPPNDGYATFTSQGAHNLSADDRVYIYSEEYLLKSVYTVETSVDIDTFTVDTSGGSLDQKNLTRAFFIKQEIPKNLTQEQIKSKMSIVTEQENVTKDKTKSLFLKKNFETLPAKRASIGIRDIFVGMEMFADAAEIVSKPFAINGKLDLVSLQVDDFEPVEKDSTGETIGVSKIRYYVSVDNGSRWIEISPIGRPFAGIPEILAFNQNLTSSPAVPQIAYYNSPEVPEDIRSIIFKAVMRKERNVQATPILYSYKLGIKVI